MVENGVRIEFASDKAQIAGRVTAGKVLVDGLGVGDVGNIVLRDRKQLSQDGIIIVVITLSKEDGNIIAGPDIISRGFVYVREAEELLQEAKEQVRLALAEYEGTDINEVSNQKFSAKRAGQISFRTHRRRPMILPIVMEI